jgi:hypothetical protein
MEPTGTPTEAGKANPLIELTPSRAGTLILPPPSTTIAPIGLMRILGSDGGRSPFAVGKLVSILKASPLAPPKLMKF